MAAIWLGGGIRVLSGGNLVTTVFFCIGRKKMKRVVVTVIGADRVGIIAGVSNGLASHMINILTVSQTIVDGIFNMVLMCDMEASKDSLADIQKSMGEVGERLGVEVRVQLADVFYAMHRI